MWWLILPVLIYSAGLFILWLILVSYGKVSVSAAPGLPGASTTEALGSGFPVVSHSGAAGNRLPKISVIVAVRNEEKSLPALLESLEGQDYPSDLLEVIIVNDNSTDRTPVVVSEFIASRSDRPGPRIRLIYNPFSGKKRAVRYAIEKASGEVIITTDADCTVGPEWVRCHASWYREKESGQAGKNDTGAEDGNHVKGSLSDLNEGSGSADMVLAPVIQRHDEGFWSQFGVYEFSALQAVTEAAAVAGHPVMCNAANMSFRKDIYFRHSGKLHDDLASGDDMFLLQAVMRDGGTVRHDGRSGAAAETAAAVTAAALLRQRARWASKTFRYRDAATLTLAAATAACNAAVAAAAVAAFMSVQFIALAAALYAVKIIPDYLLIAGEMKKRGSRIKALPFMVSEIIYPFWFMTVGIFSLFPGSGQFGKR